MTSVEPEHEPRSLRQRMLAWLAGVVCDNALWIALLALGTAGASVWYTVNHLEFITDRNALVDPDAEFNQRFLEFTEAFGDQELMLLMVAPAPGPRRGEEYAPPPPDADQRRQMKSAADDVARKLRERPDLFPDVLERVPPEAFGDTRMLYLNTDDIRAIQQQVTAAAPLLESLAATPSIEGLLRGIRDNIEQGGPLPADPEELQQAGASLAQLLGDIRAALESNRETLGTELFAFESSDPLLDQDGYFFIWEGRVLYVPMLPAKDPGALNQIEEPLRFARDVVADVQQRYPGLALGLTGRPVIYSDEMASSSRGMALATIFAVIAVGLMFVLTFRSVARPVLAVFCLVLALCWTFGATTLLIGHLNIFAMVFGVVLVGLGIDFGIHLLSHYRQGIAHGLTVRDALFEVYAEIGAGTVLGAVTTAAAVSTAALTDFLGLAELGLICGMGIGFCLLAMLIVFPALLVLLDERRVGEGNPALRAAMRKIDKDEDGAGKRPACSPFSRVAALVVVLLVAVAAGYSGWRVAGGWVPFDYNLLKLNDPTSDGLHWEELLIQHDQRASYAVSVRGTPAELEEIRRDLQPLIDSGIVRATESILPQDEITKRSLLAGIHSVLPDEIAERPGSTTAAGLRTSARRLQASLREISARGPTFEAAFAPAAEHAAALVALARDRPEIAEARLQRLEPQTFGALLTQLQELRRDTVPSRVTQYTLPDPLKRRYLGRGPRGEALYALYIYPAENVWEHERAGEFNRAVLEVDPDATGVTIQIYESGNLIVAGFGTSVLYAFIAIVLLLFIDLRRPLAVVLALVPLFCSLAILLGVMTLTDLSFNFANFFGVPILIGTTVDAGVYLLHSQRHGDPRRTLRHTRGACLLCGMTTLLGFGALITASHVGVLSLGLVLVVGCAGGILGSYFVVPVVLAWFNQHGRRV